MLFLLRKNLTSSSSDHHCGYALVLADISMIRLVELRSPLDFLPFGFDFDFRLVVSRAEGVLVDSGSTCTISSQACTIALINDVLPMPITTLVRHIIAPRRN